MSTVNAKVSENCKKIIGNYDSEKDFKLDPAGYFLIRVNPSTTEIEVGFCKKDNVIEILVKGNTAEEVYNSFLREKDNLIPQHIAYLGKELEKAEIARTFGLLYVQDQALKR